MASTRTEQQSTSETLWWIFVYLPIILLSIAASVWGIVALVYDATR
ncbi:hypothetical protein ACFQ34_33850 [Pseudonocardia benzenivorans]|uniref:Uncharacterized protein n=1 Tax=Pseudonocardia benzenivorans TaxID=228005 RepID=A0ABW3VSQ9_9PSEU